MPLRRKTVAAICRPAVALLEPVLSKARLFLGPAAHAVCLLSVGSASMSCSSPDSSVVCGATYADSVPSTVKRIQA